MHGPLLQAMAVQRHVWSAAAATVHPADTAAAPLHAGVVEARWVPPPPLLYLLVVL